MEMNIGFDDLDIPASGILTPENLYYFSLINDAWVRVLTLDTTGRSILIKAEHPESDTTSLIIPKCYSDDMKFK